MRPPWARWGPWQRLPVARREGLIRLLLATLPLLAGAGILIDATRHSNTLDWGDSAWVAVWVFIAWRFARLGFFTSRWGVRICNPALTWWYPWSKIDHFELVSTNELFHRDAKAVALVTTRGTRRPIYALSTSIMFFRLPEGHQAVILDDLNRRAADLSLRGRSG